MQFTLYPLPVVIIYDYDILVYISKVPFTKWLYCLTGVKLCKSIVAL